jgi:hypothetical protein
MRPVGDTLGSKVIITLSTAMLNPEAGTFTATFLRQVRRTRQV